MAGRLWPPRGRGSGSPPSLAYQAIRDSVRHLRSRGYYEPLRELRFATVGREIYFQHPDGTWEGGLQPDQIIIEEVIRLDPLRLRIETAARRSAEGGGRVEKRRGVHASAPAARQPVGCRQPCRVTSACTAANRIREQMDKS